MSSSRPKKPAAPFRVAPPNSGPPLPTARGLPPMPQSAKRPATAPPSAASGQSAESQPAFTINVGGPLAGKRSSGTSLRAKSPRGRKKNNLPLAIIAGAGLLVFAGTAALAVWALNTPVGPVQAAAKPKSPTTSAAIASAARRPAASNQFRFEPPPAVAVENAAPASQPAADVQPASDFPVGISAEPATADAPRTGTTPGVASDSAPAPIAAGEASPGPGAIPVPTVPSAAEEEQFVQAVLGLYRDEKLLVKKEYPALRALFAARFARQHEEEIRQGLGGDWGAMRAWFAEHRAIQETLYTAIRPEADKIPEVLRIFNEIRKQHPDKLAAYGELAIATAVVWDEPRRGVYHYDHHAERCKANMPEQLFGALENFKYLVAAEPVMQGRIQFVPWEFLVYVVNHQTPERERLWAGQKYLAKRAMFGKCYSEVPYDFEMLNSGSVTAQLNGRDYTLANIFGFGGVCAMQADYAARVGKSIGVAAEYVRGESAGNDRHAWVMWVELKQATPTGLVFSLESHGRYRGDKYYVGNLDDPQTGKEITDRDMELRLQTVGLDAVAKRQTQLAMEVFPLICEREQLDTLQRLTLLGQVIAASPGCEPAWYAIARLARESSGDKQHAKQFNAAADRLFTTFARWPDFTWKVFDDLAAYLDDVKQRNKVYERLIVMYEAADRPDLACEARLKWADMLVEQQQPLVAVEGLALTIKRFPGEGRYVPKMLDKIELLCADVKDANVHLARFYTEFLPLVPQKRQGEVTPYAVKMFERAVDVFTRCGQPQLAQAAQLQLHKLQGGGMN